MVHTYHVICASAASAESIALQIGQGSIPDLYPEEADAVAAWQDYPAPARRLHVPWSVSLSEAGNLVSTRRLKAPELCE